MQPITTKCVKFNDAYYKTTIRYLGNYEKARESKSYERDAFMVTILAKNPEMPTIRVNLLADTPEIFITQAEIDLGITREHEIDERIQRLKDAQISIKYIKQLFRTHFPGLF